jgi:hypothetical protein
MVGTLPELVFTVGRTAKVCYSRAAHELSLSPGETEWSGQLFGLGEPALRTRALSHGGNLEADP